MQRGHSRARRLMVVWCAIVTVGALGGCTTPVGTGGAPKDPVVIVGGTFVSGVFADVGYATLTSRLRAGGYPTYLFALPDLGMGDIRSTAAALGQFVDGVLATTGAGKVDLIGHSQGGLVSRWFVKELGGAAVVDSLISLAAPHYGSIEANLTALLFGFGTCLGVPACQQMSVGSDFLDDLNAGDDTIGDVRYTNLVSTLDELVVPYTSAFLANDGNVANVLVQSQCPLRPVAHLTMATDGAVYTGVRRALRHEAVTLDCLAL